MGAGEGEEEEEEEGDGRRREGERGGVEGEGERRANWLRRRGKGRTEYRWWGGRGGRERGRR